MPQYKVGPTTTADRNVNLWLRISLKISLEKAERKYLWQCLNFREFKRFKWMRMMTRRRRRTLSRPFVPRSWSGNTTSVQTPARCDNNTLESEPGRHLLMTIWSIAIIKVMMTPIWYDNNTIIDQYHTFCVYFTILYSHPVWKGRHQNLRSTIYIPKTRDREGKVSSGILWKIH